MMEVADRIQTPTASSTSRSLRRRNRKVGRAGGVIPRGDGNTVNGRPSAPRPPVTSEHPVTLEHLDDFSGDRLLADIRVAFLLLNEARYRTIERLFGVTREQTNLVMLIAAAVLVEAAHDKLERALRGPGGPTRADAVLGAATLKELIHSITPPASRDTPFLGTLIAIAVLGALARPALGRSSRSIRAISHRTRLSFNHRYGRVIGARTVAIEGETVSE